MLKCNFNMFFVMSHHPFIIDSLNEVDDINEIHYTLLLNFIPQMNSWLYNDIFPINEIKTYG